MTARRRRNSGTAEGQAYAAPALEKGLDVLELLCRIERPLSQKQIAEGLGRSVGEIYRMLACLVDRNYVAQVADSYYITTKLFELSHINPPTHRLLLEAMPLMQQVSSDLDQSCHLTVYNQGRQVVMAKVDAPSGLGFSVRVGTELDVLVSAPGRVLLAFQTRETRKLRIEESGRRRPDQTLPGVERILDAVSARGFESIKSIQLRGVTAVAFPILDTQGHAIAALTVPYVDRIDQPHRKTIPDVQKALAITACMLSERIGGAAPARKISAGEAGV